MYGTSVRLPGEFFDHLQDDTADDPAAYVVNLKSVMQELKATPVRSHQQRKVHTNNTLATCFCTL